MGSQRLPGKVLKEINGISTLEILLNRIRKCGFPIIIATTTDKKDDILVEKIASLDILSFRGSEDDVLSRYYECALVNNFNVIIRLTADNPFVDAEFIQYITSKYINEDNEYIYMSVKDYPLGITLEIFSFKSLHDAFINAKDSKEREHVTPYIINDPKIQNIFIKYKTNKSHYRLTIDTYQDYNLAYQLVNNFNVENLNVDEIIELLDEHIDLIQLNANIHQKLWNE